MKLVLAIASVVSFQVIVFSTGYDLVILAVALIQEPLLGIFLGIPMAMTAGPCLGKPTPFKRRLSLMGTMLLQSIAFLFILGSGSVAFVTGIPFLVCSVALLRRGFREDPAKEEADRRGKLRAEKLRREQIHTALAKKQAGSPEGV